MLNLVYKERDFYENKILNFKDQIKHLSFSIYSSLALVLSKILFNDYNSTFFFLFYNGATCLTISLFCAIYRK